MLPKFTEVIPFFKTPYKEHFAGVKRPSLKNLKFKKSEHQIQEKDNVIRDLKVLVSNVNDRSCEPYNANDVTDLLEQNERLRAEIEKELLEYVIGTCPKSFNERDNKAPSTPVTRKKQVTFNDKPGTSSSNTQKPTKCNAESQHTNVPIDLFYKSKTLPLKLSDQSLKQNKRKNIGILPAKTENKKKVEDHPRTNKSVWTKVNRVDSSISSKRVVINSNSESVCKTCNKCLNSASHEMCVVNILNSVNATPTVKIVLNKGKQIWKPKGKLSDNSLNKTKQTHRKEFALGELCPLTKLSVQCRTGHPLVSGLRLFKTYDGERQAKLKNFLKSHRRHQIGRITIGAIMG
ncbi:hypothetical protein Tco_0819544 [Tanacetum coccineum]|uniref:Uncharacterized protein n=1 Tax=Tanacetum coccineum TaxID=301880 RepID=A0ABQ5A6V4_9ASTR